MSAPRSVLRRALPGFRSREVVAALEEQRRRIDRLSAAIESLLREKGYTRPGDGERAATARLDEISAKLDRLLADQPHASGEGRTATHVRVRARRSSRPANRTTGRRLTRARAGLEHLGQPGEPCRRRPRLAAPGAGERHAPARRGVGDRSGRDLRPPTTSTTGPRSCCSSSAATQRCAHRTASASCRKAKPSTSRPARPARTSS